MLGLGLGLQKSRFIAGGFDADYQAVLDYATTQGYTLPSESQRAVQNQLVVDLKAAGVWAKLDSFAVLATDGDEDFALVDWVRLSNYTAVSSPTFTTNQGFQGDAVSAYLDSNYNPSTDSNNFTQDSASIFSWVRIASTDVNAYLAGNLSIRLRNVNSSNQRLNTSVDLPGADFSGTGFMHLNRTNSTNTQAYVNGSLQASSISATSSALDILPTRFLSTPSFGGRFTDAQISIGGFGADLGSDALSLYNAVNSYISAL